jgi:aldehyde dehydrogenase (NAD+)/betaine-aldehyde dehydrogenase
MVQSGSAEGARLMTGGKRPSGSEFKRGYWIEPTMFADVTANMRIAREEIFGPVLSVFSWRDESEAIALSNATEYGLTASILTNDIRTALRTARAVKSGYVWIRLWAISTAHPLAASRTAASAARKASTSC